MTSTQRGHAKRLRFHEDTSVTSLGRTRLHQPRMSLLGKPLHYRSRDARYRRLQTRIYNFLERPRGAQAILYHMIVFCMVFMCLALSVFSTIKEYEKEAGIVLFYMETVVVVWFTIEFSLRLWSSGCRSRYQGAMGRLKFLRRPFCIIDVTTILASLVVLGLGANGQVFAASALRGLRFFQILRMVRMDRRGGTWKLLGSVVYAHRQELITTLYIGFLGLVFASFLVYLAEKDANSKAFSNFADALWWGVITLCTVGYGDAVPVTWQGKLIASFCALLGISFFALPAGILGSGFALKVQQQQRQKHMIRRRQPAASLIQALWRCYAADENSMSIATWKIHMVPPVPSPQSFKHNASFVSRLPTIRRHKSLHSPSLAKSRYSEMNTSSENVGALEPPPPINSSYSEDSVAKETSETSLSKRNSDARPLVSGGTVLAMEEAAAALPAVLCGLLRHEFYPNADEEDSPSFIPLLQRPRFSRRRAQHSFGEDDDEPRCVQLTNQHKGAIRAIRKMKYFVARRKFKEALKPYDVKDVIEQYSAGHIDLLTRVKSLQARKKFREALKPYDVKDVIEQYSSGHADLLNRVKNLHFRLDQILGKQGSKAKDVYVSKISLASRVVKVERQVDDIEAKLDQLIDVYMEDRKRLLSQPQYHVPSNPAIPPLNLNQWNPAGIRPEQKASDAPVSTTSQSPCIGAPVLSWPKPILVDKQSSEPNTPIAKNFDRPTQSATSQMGHRMKKRVTLSSIPQCTPSFLDDSSQDDSDVVIIVPSLSYKMQIPSSGITGTQFIESTSTPHVTLETNDAMFTNDNSLGMGRDTSTCDQAADGRRAVHSCYGIDDEAGTSAALLEKDVSNEFQDINRPETDSTVSHMHVIGDGDYGNRECIEGSSIEETSKCLEKDLPNEQV